MSRLEDCTNDTTHDLPFSALISFLPRKHVRYPWNRLCAPSQIVSSRTWQALRRDQNHVWPPRPVFQSIVQKHIVQWSCRNERCRKVYLCDVAEGRPHSIRWYFSLTTIFFLILLSTHDICVSCAPGMINTNTRAECQLTNTRASDRWYSQTTNKKQGTPELSLSAERIRPLGSSYLSFCVARRGERG